MLIVQRAWKHDSVCLQVGVEAGAKNLTRICPLFRIYVKMNGSHQTPDPLHWGLTWCWQSDPACLSLSWIFCGF